MENKYFHFFLFIVFLYCSKSFPQYDIVNKTVTSDFNVYSIAFHDLPFELVFENSKNKISFVEAIDPSLPGVPALPSNTFFIAIPPESKIVVKTENQIYETLYNTIPSINPEPVLFNDSILKYNPVELSKDIFIDDYYPSSELEIIGYTWIRELYCAIVKVNTHRYNWKKDEISILKSTNLVWHVDGIKPFKTNSNSSPYFDNVFESIILNYNEAKEFKTYQSNFLLQDTSGYWIDYSKQYVKLGIISDGIYQIKYEDLISYGVNPINIIPSTLKLFWKGEEIPISVNSQNDFSFNINDYIQFWCEKNYGSPDYRNLVNIGSDYLNYMDRYNDTTFIWLSWGGEPGKRIQTLNNSNTSNDTISQHLVKIHLEEDQRLWFYDAVTPRSQLPQWQENKVWTWRTIGNSGNQAFTFQAKDIVENSTVNAYVRLISHASNITTNAHKLGININSTTPADSIIFNYKQMVNFNTSFPSSTLIEGTNTLRVFGMPTQAAFHQSLIDWVDIDYYRSNKALNDSLLINIPPGIATGLRIIKISNVQGNKEELLLYKIKPEIKIIEDYQLIGSQNKTITFADTVSRGDKYLLLRRDNTKKPVFKTFKEFVNLRSNTREADYIIITHPELNESSNAYQNYIESYYNIRTELISIFDIYDEFSYGIENAEAIKDFLNAAYDNWVFPAPSFLILIGDANYDYKDIFTPAPAIRKRNLVPSFGMPVSDNWFAMWNNNQIEIPQMYVGRLPANSNSEVLFYLDKLKNYNLRSYDEWNKTFMFFSGGDATKPGELEQIRQTNQNLLSNSVMTPPVAGKGTHFYKTINPPSNFGPYSQQQIKNAIDYGGMFISYIGHSGTQTWDNGITQVTDLKNVFADRSSLISDFGCSTGKFAEPDVDSFGELFINANTDGQAITYLGNSSWGYLSTSLRFPGLFYNKILKDTILILGKAHYLAKVQQLQQFGFSEVNRVFNYCNIFFGDPIFEFALPPKPNFYIDESQINLISENPTDLIDSVQFSIEVKNLGLVTNDSLLITITNSFENQVIYENNFRIESPHFSKIIDISLPIMSNVGENILKVELDKFNEIDEIYTDDNTAQFSYIVYSGSLRAVEYEKYYKGYTDRLILLNPSNNISGDLQEIIVEIADNPEFENSILINNSLDTITTRLQLPELAVGKRYWWRSKFNESESGWSESFSFVNEESKMKWYIDSTFRSNDINSQGVIFNNDINAWELETINNEVKITSAGSNDGKYASMIFNLDEILPNTFFWGIATALIDTLTLKPHSIKYFLYPASTSGPALKNYIDSLAEGTVLAMAICDDGAQSVLGFSSGTPVRQSIKSLGSYYIDSVRYRESWSIIGKKGAPIGSVPESYRKLFEGPAIIDTNLLVKAESGTIKFPVIKNAAMWKDARMNYFIPENTNLEVFPIGQKFDSNIDTLLALNFQNQIASLDFIDSKVYPFVNFYAKFEANEIGESPILRTFSADYKGISELAVNFQVVEVSEDTIIIGDEIILDFSVYNVGEVQADSLTVKVDLFKSDNTQISILDTLIYSIDSFEKMNFSIPFKTYSSLPVGTYAFQISIDPENKIRELYKDNNLYRIPFVVLPDTVTSISTSDFLVTFDGTEIFDGDYISDNPQIVINLKYPTWFSLDDTTSVQIFLNGVPFAYSFFEKNYDTVNRTIEFSYQPQLIDGEYLFRIFTKNVYGQLENSPGFEKLFLVSNSLKVMNVFNYPNPFKDETHFTFRLTQIPDELSIKIYTVAGRLIKVIDKTSADLIMDFNKIYWDGRDEDGDAIANGVYLYRVTVRKDGKSENITQKLAVVR